MPTSQFGSTGETPMVCWRKPSKHGATVTVVIRTLQCKEEKNAFVVTAIIVIIGTLQVKKKGSLAARHVGHIDIRVVIVNH